MTEGPIGEDDLSARVRRAEYMEQMANRHASRKDAEVAEAEARLARREADVARLTAVLMRVRAELADAQNRAKAVLGEHHKPAELLRAAAEGRRDTAKAIREADPADEATVKMLDLQAYTLDGAACVVEGSYGPLYEWLPPHLWTSEMTAALYAKDSSQ